MSNWDLNLSKGYEQHILPPRRYRCAFSDVTIIEIKRGEKFCDPTKGQSPDDMLKKIKVTFLPTNEAVYKDVPVDKSVEITKLLTPTFGKRAALPGFLASLSKDGTVPEFKDGEALHAWMRSHLGCEYDIGVAPNEAKTRNTLQSIAYIGEGSGTPKIAPPQAKEGPRKATQQPDGAPLQVPFESDDIPF